MPLIIDLLNLLKIHVDGPQGHVFEGGALVDIFAGTAGDDYVEGKGGLDILSGGAGNDTLGYASSNAGVTVDLAPGLLGLITQASGGDATGDIVTADFENLVGSNYSDTLKGTSGANVLAGLAGNDSLYGRDGNDRLIGGAGADLLDGGMGFDIADYSSGAAAVTLVANAAGGWSGSGGDAQGDTLVSIERVTGTAGNDTIDASLLTTDLFVDNGDGNDVVRGGSGNDSFVYGPGVNDISGGAGDDTFFFNDHTFAHGSSDIENPTYIGEIEGGDGHNFLDLSQLSGGAEITLTEDPLSPGDVDLVIEEHIPVAEGITARIDADLRTSVNASLKSWLPRQDGDMRALAAESPVIRHDGIGGSTFDDTYHGSAGTDQFYGDAGNDQIFGRAGNDMLFGEDGNDVLQGGDGRDLLSGGSGNDSFVYAAVSGSPASRNETTLDRIEDFVHGQDRIDLSAIDADSSIAGDQAFNFTPGGFSGLGQLHVIASSTAGYFRVEANTAGSLSPDFAMLVKSATPLSADDFIL